jgi:ribosomal protein L9
LKSDNCVSPVFGSFAQDFLIPASKALFFAQGAYQDIRDRSKKQACRSRNEKRQAKQGL